MGGDAHTRPGLPLQASLAEFTEKLIARRGIEQASVLFEGQIGAATKALSARTNAIGVGDEAPHFSLPTADGRVGSLGEHLDRCEYNSSVVVCSNRCGQWQSSFHRQSSLPMRSVWTF